MKGLVLAGGSGTRLRPLTHSMPKQLIPLANRPVLEHVLANVRALGVTEVGIVVGDWAEQIAAVIGDGARLGLRVTYVRQSRPLGLAHCVRLARPFLGEDDFVMYLGDDVLADGVGNAAADFRRDRPDAQVVVQKVADPSRFGIVELDVDGAVRGLAEKPAEPRGDLALVGVYFFTAAVHAAVDRVRPGPRGELEITDAIQWLVEHGHRVGVSRYDGFWRDAGRPEDLLECNRRLLAGLALRVAGTVDAESRLTGAVVVEAGARVLRSRIDGPVVVGAGSRIEDSRLGPNTAVGRDCRVVSARLADAIVLDGASIASARGLAGSLIGRHAVVEGVEGRRLLVGDHARIEPAA